MIKLTPVFYENGEEKVAIKNNPALEKAGTKP